MHKQNKFTVSHAPFWHDGSSIKCMNLNIMAAALPAVLFGIFQFGMPALGVICLSISTAMAWEALFNFISKRPITLNDYNAGVIGMLLGMMFPATIPWWAVIIGTFVAVVVGQQVFGGIGGNPFSPAVIGATILMVSWHTFFDFDATLLSYDFNFTALAPLAALKHQGVSATGLFNLSDLVIGKEVGAIGAVSGIGIILGGIYLILRGFIRWEISVSYIAGILVTAGLFNMVDPGKYAEPMFHLFTGYTLLGAFFLATDSSSSPVHTIPMFIYGAMGGLMTILIRNIGAYPDGTFFAILLINLINPLIDNIRPKALGKGVNNA
ncbi:RnfD2 [Desulfamplus magnetovallimortis]|uniref:Ion-translocating oxidoreductase complex subunit D n=1 Tax=Desulfamplus magnetovallimortis TaxID=1246637 RepID=A0A1W1H4W6_9BACT|nr:RnfABCDGE type electron transport complex subunit D [Desulfamplus magnetovallimortis]SLM27523.1 RnfD2 [Desulfamplus magnetovallimortis]